MKRFLNQNLESMTFVFTMIVLLNAIVALLKTESKSVPSIGIIAIAIMVLTMFIVSYMVSYINFKTSYQFHITQLGIQLFIFIIILIIFSSKPINVGAIIENVIIYSLLYFSVSRIKKNKFEQLVEEINRKLDSE